MRRRNALKVQSPCRITRPPFRSILGGGAWFGTNKARVTSTLLIRRWRVDTVDAALGLRRLTLVVLTDEDSVTPLSLKTVEVADLP